MAGSRITGLIAALLAAAAIAGCGDDDDGGDGSGKVADAAAAVAELQGEERQAELIERAKKESGALQLYTSLEDETAAIVLEQFKRDTGVDVELFRANSEEVLERISRENRAGVAGADVVETNEPGFILLSRDGAFSPYDPPAREGLIEDTAYEDFTVDRISMFTVSRNTKAVPEGERPQSVTDLADPKWRGRILMEVGDYDWYVTLRDHWMDSEGLSREDADARFEAIARNASAVDGHSFMGELIAAGEFDAGASDYTHTVTRTAGKGAPIAWNPPADPLVGRGNAVGITAKVRRPYKAMLYVDWLLGPGQEILKAEGISPARKDLYDDYGVEVVRVDAERIVEGVEEARDDYAKIIELARKGPEEED
jgi:iron(III) transport system substrate-binding protein